MTKIRPWPARALPLFVDGTHLLISIDAQVFFCLAILSVVGSHSALTLLVICMFACVVRHSAFSDLLGGYAWRCLRALHQISDLGPNDCDRLGITLHDGAAPVAGSWAYTFQSSQALSSSHCDGGTFL